jgi:endonuclease/exonuclease/phosphatase (EEP) superfamily protein YafD
LRILALAAGSAVAFFSLLAFADDRFWIADLATSVRPQLLVIGLVVAVLAILGRSLLGLGLAVVAVVANALVLAPLYTDDPASATTTARLTIGHVNMQGGSGSLVSLEHALDDRRPDVFVVLEPPVAWFDETVGGDAGYRNLPSRHANVLVLARTRVSDVAFLSDPKLPPTALAFTFELGGTRVRALAVHVLSPTTPGAQETRNEELAAVARWSRRGQGSEIVLGDLNATPWSSAVERLETAGDLRSSADGFGIQATWPTFAWRLGIPIDQLLHSTDLTVTDRSVGPSFGSAHRSLWVTIARSSAGG